ncbi:MAG TPA: deoxyribodipyrimidine photo-lyase [Burkholderiales bacterium]|nr:deoxyribodipyrimidine photo-lyase [Burkholderiales bacterium]
MNKQSCNLFWFRRDLRLIDNNGLYQSLKDNKTICCFIFDKIILQKLKSDDCRVGFIYNSLLEIKKKLKKFNADLIIEYGDPKILIPKIAKKVNANKVYANEDYEPYAISRDKAVEKKLKSSKKELILFKDHLIFAKQEILNKENKPYVVYTHYKNMWLSQLNETFLHECPSKKHLNNLLKLKLSSNTYLKHISKFNLKSIMPSGEIGALKRLKHFLKDIESYKKTRDFPELDQTSHLGVDLRFGTISIRKLVSIALEEKSVGSKTWLNELIWREFFSQILYNFPYVVKEPFRKQYSKIKYKNNKKWFEAWCNGETGYPIVDAGMRQLNSTGFMHNRVRMICASFLTKDLLIDWRWGERYLAEKLIDYELASNNGNWQWCASTGCDAQPYFRIFNPLLQSKKFDKKGIYIKKYVPELDKLSEKDIHAPYLSKTLPLTLGKDYPYPIVTHNIQVKLFKELFKKYKN